MSTNGLGGLGVCVCVGGGGGVVDLRTPALSPMIRYVRAMMSCSKAGSLQITLVIRL